MKYAEHIVVKRVQYDAPQHIELSVVEVIPGVWSYRYVITLNRMCTAGWGSPDGPMYDTRGDAIEAGMVDAWNAVCEYNLNGSDLKMFNEFFSTFDGKKQEVSLCCIILLL